MTWLFKDSPDLAIITTRQVIDLGYPILRVTHDSDDGGWQFLCGTSNETDDARVISLEEILKRDETLAELHDLPLGWVAWRKTSNSPWQRQKR
ncbi:MAG: hypothetical protein K1X66_02985 [Verrucomicrobiae bacterium]|nr:hypothetical protein [Verrucomicrobiae bacterium]